MLIVIPPNSEAAGKFISSNADGINDGINDEIKIGTQLSRAEQTLLHSEQIGVCACADEPQLVPHYPVNQQPVRGNMALLISRPVTG